MSLFDFLFNPSAYQGRRGESYTSRRLHALGDGYRVINNVMLPSGGKTHATQIDHIVVSNFGIFCIETKSHEGLVFGTASRKQWTYIYYKDKYKIYNPLFQNYAHIKALERILGSRVKRPIVSLVIFPFAHTLKINGTDQVGRTDEIIRKISTYRDQLYADNECDDICNILLSSDINNRRNQIIHNSEVQELTNR